MVILTIVFMGCITFLIFLVLEVAGEGHQVPAGPGADQRNGGTMGALRPLLPLTHVGHLHGSHCWDQIINLGLD